MVKESQLFKFDILPSLTPSFIRPHLHPPLTQCSNILLVMDTFFSEIPTFQVFNTKELFQVHKNDSVQGVVLLKSVVFWIRSSSTSK